MRTITLNEYYFYKKVVYRLLTRNKIGIEVSVTMENGNESQFYYPSNWRTFKKYIQ